jgi:hypothetical protein
MTPVEVASVGEKQQMNLAEWMRWRENFRCDIGQAIGDGNQNLAAETGSCAKHDELISLCAVVLKHINVFQPGAGAMMRIPEIKNVIRGRVIHTETVFKWCFVQQDRLMGQRILAHPSKDCVAAVRWRV